MYLDFRFFVEKLKSRNACTGVITSTLVNYLSSACLGEGIVPLYHLSTSSWNDEAFFITCETFS